MNVQKTVTHGGMTLAHGSFEAHETILECGAGCRDASRSAHHAPAAATHPVPNGRPAIAVTRALAQWVLDYPADGRDEGLPFDVPYLDLYERCQKSRRALETFLRTPPADARARRCLERLHRIVAATLAPTFQAPTRTLQERRQLLDELRTALRVEVKAHLPPPALQQATPQAIAEDREVSVALAKLASSLRERLLDRGPTEQTRQAIGILLAHLARHGASLSGHAIPIPPELGGGVRLVERTNVRLENFFGAVKHGERKRCGRKDLAADLEHLPGAAPLASNLCHPDYLEILNQSGVKPTLCTFRSLFRLFWVEARRLFRSSFEAAFRAALSRV